MSAPPAPHLTGNPNGNYVPLAPPTLLRTRVFSPEEMLRVEDIADATFTAVTRRAEAFRNAPTVTAWSHELLQLQEAGRLPAGSRDLIKTSASFGLAAADLEQAWGWCSSGSTAELIHIVLAVMAFEVDDAEHLIQAIAIDGAYYIARSGTSSSTLASSIRGQS